MKRASNLLAISFLAVSASACSALTEPQEITISAEPIASPNAAPAPVQQAAARPGAAQMPAAAGGERKGG